MTLTVARRISYSYDLDWARSIYNRAVEKADDVEMLTMILYWACDRHEGVRDDDWVRTLIDTAVEKAGDEDDVTSALLRIADPVCSGDGLDDAYLAHQLCKKAIDMSKDADDYEGVIDFMNEMGMDDYNEEWFESIQEKLETLREEEAAA